MGLTARDSGGKDFDPVAQGYCEIADNCKKLGRPDNWRG